MTVKVFEKRTSRSGWITRLLKRYEVQHQLVSQEELLGASQSQLGHLVPVAAVEIDGRLLVNPNEDALKKFLHVG